MLCSRKACAAYACVLVCTQLEEAEVCRETIVKAKRSVELELEDVQQQLEDAVKGRLEAEEKAASASREKESLQAAVEEHECDVSLATKRYDMLRQQQIIDQQTIAEHVREKGELQAEIELIKQAVQLQDTPFHYYSLLTTLPHFTYIHYSASFNSLPLSLLFLLIVSPPPTPERSRGTEQIPFMPLWPPLRSQTSGT